MTRVSKALVNAGWGLILPVALFVLWWFVSEDSTNVFFPSLRSILQTFRQNWLFQRAGTDLEPSFVRFVIGLAIAVICGILGGIALGTSRRARRNLWPITEILRSTPFTALVPLALILFGPGASMEIALIAFASWWPILLNTADGIRGVDTVLLDSARVYGVSPLRRTFRVALPAAAPRVFAGIRIAVAIAVAATVISNMFAAANGLGYFVIDAESRFNIRDTWSGVIVIGLLGLFANLVFLLVERHMLRWYHGWRSITTAN